MTVCIFPAALSADCRYCYRYQFCQLAAKVREYEQKQNELAHPIAPERDWYEKSIELENIGYV